jgi:hypothetical protein
MAKPFDSVLNKRVQTSGLSFADVRRMIRVPVPIVGKNAFLSPRFFPISKPGAA